MKRLYLLLCLGVCLSPLSGQITIDGNITETDWGTPLSEVDGTSADPVAGFGADFELTAFRANFNGTDLAFALAGQMLDGNSIIVFVDGTTGGYSDCNFGRFDAPQGINNINSGITFDAGFTPEFAVCIENFMGTYFWNTYILSGTAGSGGGPKTYLGEDNMEDPFAAGFGIEIGTNPTGGGSKTQGFEVKLPVSTLPFTPGTEVRIMAMLISNGGFLSNQFLTPASLGEGNFGNGSFSFAASTPDFFTYALPTLPVELVSFSGAMSPIGAALTWTASEEAFSHYDVQRLHSDGTFESIGRVHAQGEPGVPTTYEYLDPTPANLEKNVYRLAMVDIDGSVNYSHQIELAGSDRSVSLSPNPSTGQIFIELPGPVQSHGSVEVLDMRGQRLWFTDLEASGQTRWTLDLGQLPAGIYQAVIRWDGQQSIRRISLN